MNLEEFRKVYTVEEKLKVCSFSEVPAFGSGYSE